MKSVKIHFLNTIWSDAIILQVGDHFAFIDTGTDFYYPMIKDHLNELNITKIDFILLTHFHSDHYGCIDKLINDYNVENLYLKKYYGSEGSTSGGVEAKDTYIISELEHYDFILSKAKKFNTNVTFVDQLLDVDYEIDFCGLKLKLYNVNNDLYDIYNDKNGKYYNVRSFSENFNSIVVFFIINDFSVLLGSDLTCEENEIITLDNKAIKIVKDIYKHYNINHIDIFKSCHHGHTHNNPYSLLTLINPNYTIITNTPKWVDNFTICSDIKKINPDCEILLTDYQKYIFTIDNNISYKSISDVSLFITLEKE